MPFAPLSYNEKCAQSHDVMSVWQVLSRATLFLITANNMPLEKLLEVRLPRLPASEAARPKTRPRTRRASHWAQWAPATAARPKAAAGQWAQQLAGQLASGTLPHFAWRWQPRPQQCQCWKSTAAFPASEHVQLKSSTIRCQHEESFTSNLIAFFKHNRKILNTT